MKILELRSITVKKYNHAGSSKTDNTKEYPNILGQNFNVDNPGQKWVGDIYKRNRLDISSYCNGFI